MLFVLIMYPHLHEWTQESFLPEWACSNLQYKYMCKIILMDFERVTGEWL